MLKTEMINPKTVNIDKMDTLSMIDIINEENLNAVHAVQAESAHIAQAIEAITDGLNKGEKIQISGFGTFALKTKEAREGVNPKTGAKIKIAASKIPTFKFGKAYKDSFNK